MKGVKILTFEKSRQNLELSSNVSCLVYWRNAPVSIGRGLCSSIALTYDESVSNLINFVVTVLCNVL